MGGWYWIGVAAGLGTAVGVLLVGAFGAARALLVAAVALAAGAGLGYGVDAWQAGSWGDVVAGGAGGLLGGLGAAPVVGGALRRGGTRGGTAALVAAGAVLVAALGLIPVAGYLEALALPALALRLRRTRPERYAGLRTLAKD